MASSSIFVRLPDSALRSWWFVHVTPRGNIPSQDSTKGTDGPFSGVIAQDANAMEALQAQLEGNKSEGSHHQLPGISASQDREVRRKRKAPARSACAEQKVAVQPALGCHKLGSPLSEYPRGTFHCPHMNLHPHLTRTPSLPRPPDNVGLLRCEPLGMASCSVCPLCKTHPPY